jgi:hypothetical protein
MPLAALQRWKNPYIVCPSCEARYPETSAKLSAVLRERD